jgi:hypothetical protein
VYRFHDDRVEWDGPHGAGVLSHAACGDPWELAYDSMRRDDVLALNVAWSAAERARIAAWPADARHDVASVWCPAAGNPVFVRVDAGTTWSRRASADAAIPLTRSTAW